MENKICSCCKKEKDLKCYNKCYNKFYNNKGIHLRGECKDCQEEVRKRYDDSEKGKATRKRYTEEHKEDSKKYREKNKEHFKEISRIYIQEHKEEIKEKKHERVICECGAELSRASMNQNRHKNSKQYLQFVNSNTM